MSSLYASVPGRVVRVTTAYSSAYATIQFEKDFDYATVGCVITEASVRQRGNFQVLSSVSDLINIDTFGDEVAMIQVSGLAFLDVCGGTPSGVDGFLNYYRDNRLAVKDTAIKIAFGKQLFQGFLVESETRLADPEIGLGYFNMTFVALSV